jgi:hypothetical protein
MRAVCALLRVLPGLRRHVVDFDVGARMMVQEAEDLSWAKAGISNNEHAYGCIDVFASPVLCLSNWERGRSQGH